MEYRPAIIADKELWLLPDRAIYWPSEKTLLVADIHIGKAASFRAGGIPIPHGTTQETLTRLSRCISIYETTHIVFLGDFLHSAKSRAKNTFETVEKWRDEYHSIKLTLIRGNHDRHAGDPPANWNIDCVTEPYILGPFALCHHPQSAVAEYVLAGHLHPAVSLREYGGKRLTLRCFWFGEKVGVLPSFGEFTGSYIISPERQDKIFVVAGDTVVPMSGLTNDLM